MFKHKSIAHLLIFTIIFSMINFSIIANAKNSTNKQKSGAYKKMANISDTRGSADLNGSEIIPEGVYEFTSQASGKNIDVQDGKDANGARIHIWDKKGQISQKWRVVRTDDGWYKIISLCSKSNRCLDFYNDIGGYTATVGLWDDHNGENQKWGFKLSNDGAYAIFPKLDPKRVLDVTQDFRGNGSEIALWLDKQASNQKWTLKRVSEIIPEGVYEFTSQASGKNMDVKDGKDANGSKIHIWDKKGQISQKWRIVCTDDGWYKIISLCSKSNRCLDFYNDIGGYTATVGLWDDHNGENQKWGFKLSSDGSYEIFPKLDSKRVLDVTQDFRGNGSEIALWLDKQAINQKWILNK